MTESEILQSALKKVEAQKDNFGFMDRFDVEEHWAVRKALEKQISKKPYVQQVVKDFREHDCYECPNCDCFVGYVSECQEEHYQDNYCSNCGQKLDWK